MKKGLPIVLGLGTGLLCLLGGWWFLRHAAGWGAMGTATRLPSIRADVFFLNVPEIVRRGPPRWVVVRLEQPVSLVPFHYQQAHLAGPLSVEEWAQRLGAPVVFNAGQFAEDLHYLGWLKSRGTWISQQRKSAWLGLLVSGPIDGGGWTRIIDLEHADNAIVQRYQNVMQSMMLVDEAARVRVRQSELAACRTIIAEDQSGRILVIATEGAVTLHDMARWLPQSGLNIVRAMNLDGGIESQLAINTPELNLILYGQYGTSSTVFEPRGQIRYPLPAVIALMPQ